MAANRLFSGVASRFRRITTAGGYLPEIDGLRFVAIVPVAAYHTWGYWGRMADCPYPSFGPVDAALTALLALGHYGVNLFFMISGFVLATPFCKHALQSAPAVDLRRYFWRRVTRLEPPYVASMLIFFLAAPYAGKGSWAELFPHLLASLGYVHELVYNEGSPINNNAWSLEIEVQFYLLMPVLAGLLWLPATTRRTLLASLILLLSTHRLWLEPSAPRTIIQYGSFFLSGVLLNDLWTMRWKTANREWYADLPGIIAWPSFIALNTAAGGAVADMANPWLMAMFFYSTLRGVAHSRILSYGAIPLIGGMCYSIYLLHARVIAITLAAGADLMPRTGMFWANFSVAFLMCSLSILLVCSCFFLLIEKPCMDPDWPRKLWNRVGLARTQASI